MVNRRTPPQKQRKDLGNIIRYRRKELGLTQEELADAMNCSTHWINKIEGGKSDPNCKDMLCLIRILELDCVTIAEEIYGFVPVFAGRK